MADGTCVKGVALQAGIAASSQLLRQAAKAILPGGIEFEYLLYYFCLLRNDSQLAILFIIAPQTIIAQHTTVLDRLAKAEFQSLRELAHFVLCHTCHDYQSELAVAIQCVDVVVLE